MALTHKQIDQRRQERDRILLEIRTLKRRAWILGQEILTGRVYVERGAGQLSLLDTAQARTGALFSDELPAPAVQELPPAPAPKKRGRPRKAQPPAPAPKKRGRPRKHPTAAELAQTAKDVIREDGPAPLPTTEDAIRSFLESCAALDKPGATLEQIADFLKWASDTTEARGDVQRAIHKAGAIEREGRYLLPAESSPAPAPASLRTRLLKRLDGPTYRGVHVLALLEGAPAAEVAAHLEQFEREGLLSARGPGANGKGFVLKAHERRKASLRPTLRINWHRGIEALDRFIARRTKFTPTELREALDCSKAEAEEMIVVLMESTTVMQSAEDEWEVIEGFEREGRLTEVLIEWWASMVTDAKGTSRTPEQWGSFLEMDPRLLVCLSHLAIKAKKIKRAPTGALIPMPEKKGKKK